MEKGRYGTSTQLNRRRSKQKKRKDGILTKEKAGNTIIRPRQGRQVMKSVLEYYLLAINQSGQVD